MTRELYSIGVLIFLCTWASQTLAFSFSEEEQQQRAENQRAQQQVQSEIRGNLSTACPQSARERRIMVVLSEAHQYGIQVLYHFDAARNQLFRGINHALNNLGLRTYTPQQITAQIAEAELQAVANGNLDAAMSAASRLGADYILKANIKNRFSRNVFLGIKEVSVSMAFELHSASGALVGATASRAESFSGEDTLSVAQTIINERANIVASRLYRDLCAYEAASLRR